MDILKQSGIALLSLLIAFVSNAAARLLPQQTPSAPQSSAPATKTASDLRVEYASLQSAALGKELKFAVQFPPSYERDSTRRCESPPPRTSQDV